MPEGVIPVVYQVMLYFKNYYSLFSFGAHYYCVIQQRSKRQVMIESDLWTTRLAGGNSSCVGEHDVDEDDTIGRFEKERKKIAEALSSWERCPTTNNSQWWNKEPRRCKLLLK